MTPSRTATLLATLWDAPQSVVAEKLAEHAYRLEDELELANDSYDALRKLFILFIGHRA